MKTFWQFFFLQALTYCLVDTSNRFVAQGAVALSVSSGMVYFFVNINILKRLLKEADSKAAIAGATFGGGLGTYLGIVISKAITGV